ncbi:hypothetical protein [Actinokineospora cianjurensis]|uniref:Ig-like domain-containing protein n=1 Tax=Actinokineospora cianjurensis TaxID=585224 RepID=A0A421B2F8_9PSEU|nr:hypothetical protein [Actinokineospora cianjurensis]RLK58559.1 hypothetical protein CLV68_3027 [Actinokineospora cianjurensis]
MAIVLAALTAVAMMVFPGAPAGAVTVDAHCLGGFSRNFSPAITVTPQTVTVSGTYDYGTCLVGATATGSESVTLSLGCVPVTAGPAFTETVTWHDATGGTSTIDWAAPTIAGQTVVYTGTVTAGRHAGDTATKVTSGTSYLGSVVGCLLGTPISDTTGLVDSFLLTH